MNKPVVIDTGVLVDIFLESRPRHIEAKKIAAYLVDNGISVKLPMHGLFELTCAIRNEGMSTPIKMQRSITEATPLHFEPINIDEGFFTKYFDPEIPYLKAGDLIFVSLAKGDGAILITEDNNQYKVAKAAGVKVFRIKEFLNEFISG